MNRLPTSAPKQLSKNYPSLFGHSRQYTLTIIFYLLWINCLAQKKDTIDISNQLYNPFYKICQTDTAVFQIFYGYHMYENSPITKTDFYRVLGSKKDNNCRTEYIESIDNKSLKLEGNGVNVLSYELKPSANSFPAYWVVSAKFNATGTPTISWKVGINYGQNDCGYESTETLYRGTYRKIFSIPKPSTPIVTALKAVVRFPESTTISCSDCPNTLAGEVGYPYSNGSSDVAFSFQCGPNGQPDFSYFAIHYYAPPYALPFDYRQTYYKPGAVFHARCNDNGCLSDISDPLAVTIRSKDSDCPGREVSEADNVSRSDRKDYHHFNMETEVCQTGSNAPNCSADKVYKMLKENKSLAVPIGFDFPETVPALVRGYGKDFGNWETYVPLMGSSLLFKLDTDPVTDCGRVALPSAVGILANLSALVSAGPLAHLITRELTASSD